MNKYLIILLMVAVPWYLSAQSTEIGNGASVTIGAGASLSIGTASTPGTITCSSVDGLIVESANATSSGSLIGGGTPNATVERYVPENANHLVTPVTTNVTANDFYIDDTHDAWLSSHDPSNNTWSYIIKPLSTPLSRGQGYSYWASIDNKVSFKGELTGADVTVSLTKGTTGWNLLGNPFPSALDWTSVTAGNTTGVVYVYSNTAGGYLYSNGGSGVGSLPNNIIPMGQGFFVEATSSGNFTIPSSVRIHDHPDRFYKNAKEDRESTQFIRIDIDGGYYGNTIFIGFSENGTDDFDIPGDATKLYSTKENIQVFAVENEKELCINSNASLKDGESKTVPLYVVQATGKSYTMMFSDLDQLPNVNITLEDLKTGDSQNISENPVYTFTASADDEAHRFQLHFAGAPNGLDEGGSVDSNIQIYANGNDVYIRSTNSAVNQNGVVYIYDMMGRKLTEQNIGHGDLAKVKVNTSAGYVIVKVVKKGSIKTQKVLIK